MDSRIELRKKEFKKTFEDPRRRREEAQVQIRKQNRDVRLAKKRQQAFDELSEGAGGNLLMSELTQADLSKIPPLVQGLMSDNLEEQFNCCQQFRKLLSIEKNPPLQQVIDAKVVPRFIEFLRDDTRQELQFEAAWALTNIASGSQDQTRTVIDHGAIPVFVKLLSSVKDEVREQAIWALGNIAGDCPDFRDLVINCGGLNPLLCLLRYALQNPSKVTMLRNATWTLSNLCRGKPRPALSQITPSIPLLRELIFSTDVEVLTDACWALSYISDGNDQESNEAIDAVVKSGVCQRIIQLLGHSSFAVVTPALRTVGNIVSGSESQTQTMVVAGCIPALRNLLHSPRKVIRKEACWSLSNITAGTREQIGEAIREGIFPQLMQLAQSADYDVKREANWAFVNAASGANPQQIQYLVDCKILQPLCEVLEWTDEKLVGVALDAIEAILKTGELLMQEQRLPVNPYIHLIEEAGGFTRLENLQFTPEESKVYQTAMRIMTTYLAFDEDVTDTPSYQIPSNQMNNGNAVPNIAFDFGSNQPSNGSNAMES